MPFTVSHIAAVLPWRRSRRLWLNFSGLALGSMIPDFNYFFRLPFVSDDFTHSFLGGIVYAIPAGILTVLAVGLLYSAIVDMFPNPYRTVFHKVFHDAQGAWHDRSEAASAVARPWVDPIGFWKDFPAFLGFLIAITLGSWTHSLWDACTHRTGFVAEKSEWLQSVVFQIGDYDFRLFHLLQHLSSILGLLYAGTLFVRWLRVQPEALNSPRKFLGFPIPKLAWTPRTKTWLIIFSISLLYMIGFLIWGFKTAESLEMLRHYLVWSVAVFLRGVILQILLLCLYRRIKGN